MNQQNKIIHLCSVKLFNKEGINFEDISTIVRGAHPIFHKYRLLKPSFIPRC